MTDFAAFVAMAFSVSFLIIAPLVGLAMWISYATCQSQLKVGGLEGTWGPLIECQVKMSDGNYIPYDRWRGYENIELKREKR